jgi:hypothetical protein
VPDGTGGTVGVPANGPSSSLTDNGQPVQETKKSAPASPSEAIPSARPGYTYLEGLGHGAHLIQVTGR